MDHAPNHSMIEALKRAKQIAGGNTGLAKAMDGLTPQAVSQWEIVPPLRVLDVERITGVPRHELRSDIYPAEDFRPCDSEAAQ